jgi:tRNA (uracil-5-)-methyltransferase TRM9
VVTGKVEQQGIVAGNDIITLGLDRSANLVDLARDTVVLGERVSSDDEVKETAGGRRVNEVCVGDAIASSYRSRCFDFALSIATIHHFSTTARRVEAVKELIRIVRPVTALEFAQIKQQQQAQGPAPTTNEEGEVYRHIAQQGTGRFLIYVWALEQRGESRRKFEQIPRRNGERGRDLLVPWVLKSSDPSNEARKVVEEEEDKVYQRCESVGLDAIRGQTRSFLHLTINTCPFPLDYHVFEQGELETLVEVAANQFPDVTVHLEMAGWEKGNWYGIWQCVES